MDEVELQEIEDAYYDEMAQFCLATGYHPDVYWTMDQTTIQAFARVLAEQANEQKKGGN